MSNISLFTPALLRTYAVLSVKPAKSFSVFSYQRCQDMFLRSFWVSSFHSRTLLWTILALSLVLSLLKSNWYTAWVCHKITSIKSGHDLELEELPKFCGSTSIFTQWLKLGTSNLVYSLGLPKPTINPHPEKKWAWPWVRQAAIYLGFPFNIFATAALSS